MLFKRLVWTKNANPFPWKRLRRI